MNFFQSIAGVVDVEVTSADISKLLTSLNEVKITVRNIEYQTDIAVKLTIDRRNFKRCKTVVHEKGGECRIIHRAGVYWGLKNLLHRPVLLGGIAIILLLTLYLPTKILFVTVEGNSDVPQQLILEQAQLYGIYFGADRRSVRSERVKNGLLGAIHQLQWVGVNTYGCVAKISVRERSVPETPQENYPVSSIVAIRDGLIKSCTVNRGTALCTVGQAVSRGQVLISGYTDCGLCIRAERADGEVMAETNRSLQVVTPEEVLQRGQVTGSQKKISLIIGKKRINFFKDSGILDPTCVKMYSENYMTLPGSFRLPVILVVEKWISCDMQETDTQNQEELLKDFAQRYLSSQMIAGQILHQEETVDGCMLEGQYICLEMIGQVRYEVTN